MAVSSSHWNSIRKKKKKPFLHSVSSIFQAKKKIEAGVTKLRVKPYSETVWMSPSELLADAQKPSKYYVDYSSSCQKRMGTLSVEVLEMRGVRKCDLISRKSDPYVVFVFEDKAMKTDYISKCLSPVFPHKCKRAVKFPITTPAASLYVGAFDYDTDVTHTNIEDDDPLGRVVVKLSCLRPNTEYDVVYPLQHSELKRLNGERGFIRLRMRLNWEGNDRKVLTSYLKPQDSMILTTNDRKLWAASLYCIHGKHIGDEYNWNVFMSYVNELKGIVFLLQKPLLKFVMDIVFWRKPFRSLFLCLSWQYLVLHPTYIPSFIVFSILATAHDTYVTNSSRRPKLHRVTPLYDIFLSLIGGGLFWKFRGIDAPTETKDHLYVDFDDQLASLDPHNLDDGRTKTQSSDLDVSDILGGATEEGARTEKSNSTEKKNTPRKSVTKTSSLLSLNVLNPMSLVLGPLQIVLKNVCMGVRTANNLFTWKDPFASFWTTSILFVLWIVVTIFPYAFFFFWLFRILGFVILGPQNAIIWWHLQKKKLKARAEKAKDEDERFRVLEIGCSICKAQFGLFNGKHHCRNCGEAVCGPCSPYKMKVEVSMFGSEKGTLNPTKKKRVCALCFRGEKVFDHEKRNKMKLKAREAVDDDPNLVLDGFKGAWSGVKKVGKGVARGGEFVGTGLVQGTMAVGEGVVDGTAMVGKGTGKLLKKTGKSLINLGDNQYTLEVPVERSMTHKFIDRPRVDQSSAKKIRENKKDKTRKSKTN
ncbi:hypothetical protein TrCOL_g8321 [Triparma columacea]|uniref:FYVE-type domain-containing protein n=1 Tax=Triparma columacea TaxID=722753 RepID=A0A9W7L4J7_9STRA|nr:hypothetical protein TrCOL_g8321 [Triparma columacea]